MKRQTIHRQQTTGRTLRSTLLAAAVLLGAGLLGSPVSMAGTRAASEARWVTLDRLNTLIDPGSVPAGSQIEVSLVKQDPRLGGVDCPSPLLANTTGNRLWGRTFLRVQCLGTDTPGFFVGVDVKVYAPVLVMKNAVASGQDVTSNDVEFKTLDIAQLGTGWVAELSHLNQKTAARALWPGAILKPDLLKGQPMVKSGDTVKVLIQGPGFSIGGSAIAMDSAEQGQTVKVKTPQGKVLQGIAVEPLQVEVTL
ncbi:flagellar basal body P-ring formation chaperone FlgA [Limnobacter humi]|uniref:Flagellar basal body P-ring formation chaperone FlgA n=1 Tax=Limnobacter humi TaxID=1778671 RepID=A0ABT1WK76_9BURK|nr:flagellar basal body P-ring formation chaperone FlgA [Limnobacter humi]MCQ8897368.1 flagellar basal body P-ring formation chaperone FlgA [Limnobacter humi]